LKNDTNTRPLTTPISKHSLIRKCQFSYTPKNTLVQLQIIYTWYSIGKSQPNKNYNIKLKQQLINMFIMYSKGVMFSLKEQKIQLRLTLNQYKLKQYITDTTLLNQCSQKTEHFISAVQGQLYQTAVALWCLAITPNWW
jgi:hypothetical protein